MPPPSQPAEPSTPTSITSTSSDEVVASSKSRRRGSRTLVACEACKKRKTKCSGRPSPCETCQKLDTFCHFNSKLDARRKTAYKPIALHEKKEYILSGILKALKFNESEDVAHLIEIIRSDAPPQRVATCLKQHLRQLQNKNLIPQLDVDENDIVSLSLQSLFSHRGKRAGPNTKDQKASLVASHESKVVKPSRGDARVSYESEDDHHVSFLGEDQLDSPEAMEKLSPILTGFSKSSHLSEDIAHSASAKIDSTSQVRAASSDHKPLRHHMIRGSKRKTLEDRSLPQMPVSEYQQSTSALSYNGTYNTAENNMLMHDYPHHHGLDQISPTDHFYTLFNSGIGPDLRDRVGEQRVQHFKPINIAPASMGTMPQFGWSHPQLNGEIMGSSATVRSQNVQLQDSLFVENMFQRNNASYGRQQDGSHP